MTDTPAPPPASVLAAAREAVSLAAKATPGPWRWHDRDGIPSDRGGFQPSHIVGAHLGGVLGCDHRRPSDRDADLIAHAGTHYGAIAAALLETQRALDAVQGQRDAAVAQQKVLAARVRRQRRILAALNARERLRQEGYDAHRVNVERWELRLKIQQLQGNHAAAAYEENGVTLALRAQVAALSQEVTRLRSRRAGNLAAVAVPPTPKELP